jgi:transcriptional regulator with XRE-family HTH domain
LLLDCDILVLRNLYYEVLHNNLQEDYHVKRRVARSKIGEALISLRGLMGESQESMARLLGVSLRTVATWETSSKPRGIMLVRLARLAGFHGSAELHGIFLDGLSSEQRRLRESVFKEMERADEISKAVRELHVFISHCHADEDVPARRRKEAETVLKSIEILKQKIAESQEWAWRNSR